MHFLLEVRKQSQSNSYCLAYDLLMNIWKAGSKSNTRGIYKCCCHTVSATFYIEVDCVMGYGRKKSSLAFFATGCLHFALIMHQDKEIGLPAHRRHQLEQFVPSPFLALLSYCVFLICKITRRTEVTSLKFACMYTISRTDTIS